MHRNLKSCTQPPAIGTRTAPTCSCTVRGFRQRHNNAHLESSSFLGVVRHLLAQRPDFLQLGGAYIVLVRLAGPCGTGHHHVLRVTVGV